jgi:2-keto-4-pentenoate hydratase/2-oxohepta-3-ene-1,7-dioic acid hydratase in catechol pathway
MAPSKYDFGAGLPFQQDFSRISSALFDNTQDDRVEKEDCRNDQMKYCRFEANHEDHYGLIETIAGQDTITRILLMPPGSEERLDELPTRRTDHLLLSAAKLLPPTVASKIVCVGRNYREHANEMGSDVPVEPLLFLKPPSAIIGTGQAIKYPKASERVDHEAELGVVIGKTCRHVRPDEDVREYIRGYTCVNDVTARDLQQKDGQWTRAKGFDTFCPVGPVLEDDIDPWAGVAIEARVNGELKQQGNTREFIFPLDAIIRHISGIMTLFPGDLISTGTPAGVGPLKPGDIVEITAEGIGTLSNRVLEDDLS